MPVDRSKLLHRKQNPTWYLENHRYSIFMLREMSAVFVALAAVATIMMVLAVKAGPAEWERFLGLMAHPGMLALSGVALAFAILHSVTWFLLAGKVLVIRKGEMKVPAEAIIGGHFAGWLAVSVVIAVLVLRVL